MENGNLKILCENQQLIAEIHEKLPELETEFKKIRQLVNHSVTNNNFNAAINSFYKIFIMVPLMKTSIQTKTFPLFRARPNDEKNVLFTKEYEISYNSTNKSVIKAGRFNGPTQSLFYASLPVENSNINASMAACLETCKGLTDHDYPVDLKDFTIGRWDIKTSFFVVNFCFDNIHLNGNEGLKHTTESYLNAINTCLSKESSGFVFRFLTYFSEMSGRKSLSKNEYYILTALFYAVKYYYKTELGEDIYGIIYPGAATEAKGLNVVLTPEAVDLFLNVDVVMMYRFILDRTDRKSYSAYPCSDMVTVTNGEFAITNFLRIPEERLYTIECESDYGPLRQAK